MAGRWGGEGEILRTTDGGRNWVKQDSGTTQPLRAIAFSAPEHGCIVGDETLVTTDGGESWKPGGALVAAQDVAFVDDDHGAAATTFEGVFTTDDGGLTWQKGTAGSAGPVPSYACCYADSQHIWAGGATGALSVSADGGDRWTGTSVAAFEQDAQRVGVLSPASASTAPGGQVKLRMQNIPLGWTVDITGSPAYPASAQPRSLATRVSSGAENQDQLVTIPRTAAPRYLYTVGLSHRGGPLHLETAVQLSTLKSSRAVVSRGGTVNFSGIVPTQGHLGTRAGKSKYVYLYKSTRSATKGFRLVKRYRANGYGKYAAGLDRPTRTSWYLVLYAADAWYWEATTPVVKVVVK